MPVTTVIRRAQDEHRGESFGFRTAGATVAHNRRAAYARVTAAPVLSPPPHAFTGQGWIYRLPEALPAYVFPACVKTAVWETQMPQVRLCWSTQYSTSIRDVPHTVRLAL